MFYYKTKTKDGRDTWSLLPVSKDCAILDATYFPDEAGLLIMLDSKKETFMNRPVQNDRGESIKNKDGSYRTREVRFETYYEHFITDKEQINDFVKRFAVNYKEFAKDFAEAEETKKEDSEKAVKAAKVS